MPIPYGRPIVDEGCPLEWHPDVIAFSISVMSDMLVQDKFSSTKDYFLYYSDLREDMQKDLYNMDYSFPIIFPTSIVIWDNNVANDKNIGFIECQHMEFIDRIQARYRIISSNVKSASILRNIAMDDASIIFVRDRNNEPIHD